MFRLCDMLKKNTQACEECEKNFRGDKQHVQWHLARNVLLFYFWEKGAAMYIFLYKPGLLAVLFYN